MVLQLNLYAQAVLSSSPMERWAEGFSGGFVKGALIGGVIAVVIAILKGSSNWGGSAATQARLAARGQTAMGAPSVETGSSIGCGRIVRGVLLFGAAVLCGLLGIYYILAGTQVQNLAEVAQATPQPLTAAQLLEKGAGKNLHLELQQFTFGPPTIEKNDTNEWEHVWMVLTPTPASAKGKYTALVLRSSKVKDQAGLDELRKQATLDVLLTSSLGDGMPLKVKPSEAFSKAHPKLDTPKTAYVTDQLKILNLFGRDLVDADLFDTSWCNWLYAAGGVLCVLGCVLFFLIFTGKKKPAAD